MYRGRVAQLYRWPVKSLAGEAVPSTCLDERGMAGDRAFALVDQRPNRSGRAFTVRQEPRVLGWSSRYDTPGPDPDGLPVLRDPSGNEHRWDDPDLAAAIGASLGTAVALRAAAGQQDRGPTILVTTQASAAALGNEVGGAVDVRRFRPNLHLELDAPAFVEQDWASGTRITAGSAVLEVTGPNAGPCIRCAVPSWDPVGRERWPQLQDWLIRRHDNTFGVIMRVVTPGTVSIGDEASCVPLAGPDTAT